MPGPPNAKRVLIVDDASITRSILRKILSGAGFDCIEASSGEEALRVYNAERPDVVTLDIHMDRLSGMGVLQVLLKLDPNARVVVVSSEGDRAIIDQLKQLGIKSFVPKPYEPDALTNAVVHALD